MKEGYEETLTIFGGVSSSLPMLRKMKLRVTRKQPFQLGGKSISAFRIVVEPQLFFSFLPHVNIKLATKSYS